MVATGSPSGSPVSSTPRSSSDYYQNSDEERGTMSTIENLPNEILTAILLFLPAASLQQSLLISHRFRVLTELLLYASVSIQEAVQLTGSQDGGPYKTWRWCRTILERPHLVHYVKSLTIKWFADHHARRTNQHPYYSRPTHPTTGTTLTGDIDLEPIFVELATILPNLTLLESLELQLPTPVVSRNADLENHLTLGNRLLRPTSFPNLTCLAISGLIPPPQFFLPSSCPSLTTLRISDIHELPYPFPYDALPNLSSFKGSPAAAAAILPGRPVRSLGLVGLEYLRVAEWEGISRVQAIEDQAYRGIETLDLSGMSVTPNLLRDVARWVPTVKDLKIRLALRHTLHHALGGIALLTALSPVLLSLTNLTTLDMSPTTGASTAQVQEELMICQTWSKYCGLRKVVFPSGDVWIQPPKSPEIFDEGDGWVLVGGSNLASSSSSDKSRCSPSDFASTDNGAGGHIDPLEGPIPPHVPPPPPYLP